MRNHSCVLIVGNGFSMGFGFPGTEKVWDDCLISPARSSPGYAWSGVLAKALNDYPLSHFRQNEIKDIEGLLSEWNRHISKREAANMSLSALDSGRGGFESYTVNLCCHLLEYGTQAASEARFVQFAEWLEDILRSKDVRFITFNYDLILERIAGLIQRKVAFLGDGCSEGEIILRKLHGSVRWLHAREERIRHDGYKPRLIWRDDRGYTYDIDWSFDFVPYIAFGDPVLIFPVSEKKV